MKDSPLYQALAGSRPEGGDWLFREGDARGWRERIVGHPGYRTMIDECVKEGERFLPEPMPELSWTLFRRFWEDGDRTAYQDAYFGRRKRLTVFGILSWLYPEREDYRDALLNTVWAICDEYSWCLPAHFRMEIPDAPLEELYSLDHGAWVERDEALQIDLFAAETAFALSEIYRLTGEDWPASVKHLLFREVYRRVLVPYLHRGPYGWETNRNNWSAVCAGYVGAAAILLIENTEELAVVLDKLMPAFDYFLEGFGEDGVCQEGYLYWIYGFGFYTYFAELLLRRTGGKVDLFASDKVREIARFQEYAFMSGDQVVNFSDSPKALNVHLGLSHELCRRYPELIPPDAGLRGNDVYDNCGRWAPTFRNFIWIDPELQGRPWQDARGYFPEAEWLIDRTERGQFCFAAKGGHNGEPHNQNDVGHFILHGNGETFLADLGSGPYSKAYFGPERYSFLCNGSQGHSVPVIHGAYQQEGSDSRAEVLHCDVGAEASVLELELAGAYKAPGLTRLVRRFEWDRSGPLPRLSLEDAFTFMEAPSALTERFLCGLPPVMAEEGRVELAGKSLRLAVSYDAALVEAAVEPIRFTDHFGVESVYYLLDFHWKQPAAAAETYRFRIDFRFEGGHR